MPVFNVPVIPPVDLTPLVPASFGIVDCSYVDTAASSTEVVGFDPDVQYRMGGDIVNTATPGEDATVYLLTLAIGADPPTKAEVITNGIMLLPGGAYQMPLRADLSYFFAMNTGSARIVIHAFGA